MVCFDSEPQNILVSQSRRDADLTDTDSFRILLDTFNDGQNAFVFTTNPFGIEYDGQVMAGGQTGQTSGGAGGAGFNVNSLRIVAPEGVHYHRRANARVARRDHLRIVRRGRAPADGPIAAAAFTTHTSANLTFRYTTLDAASIQHTADTLERERVRIMSDLGLTQMPPVRVTLHPDRDSLRAAFPVGFGAAPPGVKGLSLERMRSTSSHRTLHQPDRTATVRPA